MLYVYLFSLTLLPIVSIFLLFLFVAYFLLASLVPGANLGEQLVLLSLLSMIPISAFITALWLDQFTFDKLKSASIFSKFAIVSSIYLSLNSRVFLNYLESLLTFSNSNLNIVEKISVISLKCLEVSSLIAVLMMISFLIFSLLFNWLNSTNNSLVEELPRKLKILFIILLLAFSFDFIASYSFKNFWPTFLLSK